MTIKDVLNHVTEGVSRPFKVFDSHLLSLQISRMLS